MIRLSKKNKAIGIDIADTTIEMVLLNTAKSESYIEKKCSAVIPPGIIMHGRLLKKEELKPIIEHLFVELDFSPSKDIPIVIGLPESQVYTQVITLPKHAKKLRDQKIQEAMMSYVSIPEEDSVMSYCLVSQEDSEVGRFLVSVTSRSIIREWKIFFDGVGVSEFIFDIEALASARALLGSMSVSPVVFLDLGANTTSVSFFHEGLPIMMYTLATAGNDMTRAVESAFGISPEEAMIKKHTLDMSNQESPLVQAVVPYIKRIVDDVRLSLDLVSKKYNLEIHDIVILGGTSRMIGLSDYMSGKLGVPVHRIDEFVKDADKDLEYIEAIGLAMRGIDSSWDALHPVFHPSEMNLDEEETVLPIRKPRQSYITTEHSEKIDPTDTASLIITSSNKLRKQILGFVCILIVGFGMILFAINQRDRARVAREAALEKNLVTFSDVQNISVKVPVALFEEEYADDRIHGRILNNTIHVADDYGAVISESRRIAEKEINQDEELWRVPLTPSTTNMEGLTFPLTFSWLAYTKEDMRSLALQALDTLNSEQVPYAYNFATITTVAPTDNNKVYMMTIDLSVSVNQHILTPEDKDVVIQESEASAKEPLVVETYVRITDTPTGFLNVRTGPGVNFEKAGTVLPEARYRVLAEEGDWIHIEINNADIVSGWVLAEYTNSVS